MAYSAIERSRLNLRDVVYWSKSKFRPSGEIVLCNSFPKSGTHLLSEVLMDIKAGQYWNDMLSVQSLSGVMNTERHINWKLSSAPKGSVVRCHLSDQEPIRRIIDKYVKAHFFIYRDPRDIVVSHANWVTKEPRIFLNKYYVGYLKSFSQRIQASIEGVSIGDQAFNNVSNPSVGKDFERWEGWVTDPGVTAVKFEDLVGTRGGGDEEIRFTQIKKIYEALGKTLPPNFREIHASESADPTKSHTFRKGLKGGIGSWREHFTDLHKELFKRHAGDLLIRLGYEDGYEW